MNKSTLAWLAAALALGVGSIYAVWAAEDSGTAKRGVSVVAAQGKGSSPDAASDKPKDAVNINPFGK